MLKLSLVAAAFMLRGKAPAPILRDLERARYAVRCSLGFLRSPAVWAMSMILLVVVVHVHHIEHDLFAHYMVWLTIVALPSFSILLFLANLVLGCIMASFAAPIISWLLASMPASFFSNPLTIPLEPPRLGPNVAA